MRTYKISPSMWSAFLEEGGCFRRGAFKYCEGLPDPGGPGAQRGTRVHTRVEDYLQGRGAPLDPEDLEDAMALALAEHIPAPGTPDDLAARGVVIEGTIGFERNGTRTPGARTSSGATGRTSSSLTTRPRQRRARPSSTRSRESS